jgi:hypothetical protein
VPETILTIPARFSGPPASGNGGFCAGALSAYADTPVVSVSLLAPPPLDTPMRVATAGPITTAYAGDSPVLRAEPVTPGTEPVTPGTEFAAWVPPAEARAAEARYAGLAANPFPTCFSCGPHREDGLRICPGRVADQDGHSRVAATWTPDASLAGDLSAVTWAALDCVGGWSSDLEARPMVLARMTARLDRLPEIGAEHVVVGLLRHAEGRKTFTASALYDAGGDLVGSAEHLWIEVDPAAFR